MSGQRQWHTKTRQNRQLSKWEFALKTITTKTKSRNEMKRKAGKASRRRLSVCLAGWLTAWLTGWLATLQVAGDCTWMGKEWGPCKGNQLKQATGETGITGRSVFIRANEKNVWGNNKTRKSTQRQPRHVSLAKSTFVYTSHWIVIKLAGIPLRSSDVTFLNVSQYLKSIRWNILHFNEKLTHWTLQLKNDIVWCSFQSLRLFL